MSVLDDIATALGAMPDPLPVEHFAMGDAAWAALRRVLPERDSALMIAVPFGGLEIERAPEVEGGIVEKHPGHLADCALCEARRRMRKT